MGLLRDLAPRDIVAQWFAARHHFDMRISNIVFMGMGEPMDNLDAVLDSIRMLADRNGPAVAPCSIAVSTVGRTRGIRQLAQFIRHDGFHRLKLAVSINAPNDDIRASIMPINRAEPMSDLMDAMREWSERGEPILIEYVLIPSINDRPEHARELTRYLAPIPCKVNVIPYNPRRESPWPAPTEDSIERFVAALRAEGVFVTRRRTMGRGVMAACGQLGNPGIRRRRAESRNPYLSLRADNLQASS